MVTIEDLKIGNKLYFLFSGGLNIFDIIEINDGSVTFKSSIKHFPLPIEDQICIKPISYFLDWQWIYNSEDTARLSSAIQNKVGREMTPFGDTGYIMTDEVVAEVNRRLNLVILRQTNN